MSHLKSIHLDSGKAMIVTDLHGSGKIYQHIRDTFLRLYQSGEVNYLIICGDLIHGYGSEDQDASLPMLLDIMQLQATYGKDTVIMLMGNHEMPHVYSISLSKGNITFTPRFERALVGLNRDPRQTFNREDVFRFLKSLPFVVTTHAGVLITHAGASPAIKTSQDALMLLEFDHDELLRQANEWMQDYDLNALKNHKQYVTQVKELLAVDSPDDPHFYDLLKGQLLSSNSGKFEFLWDVLFSTNEKGTGIARYEITIQEYLMAISQVVSCQQNVIVSGHIGVRGGHELVAAQQLRLASFAHAYPEEQGEILILDCEAPITKASQLVPYLVRTLD